MTLFKKLTIAGFKSIASGELELGSRNVVIGANGSGKSNLLGVFTLFEQVISGNLQVYVGGEPDRILHHGRKVTPLCEIILEMDKCSYGIGLIESRGTIIFRDECILLHDSNARFGASGAYESSVCLIFKESEYDDPFRSAIKHLEKIKAYHFHDVSESSPARHPSDIADNRILRKDAANLPAFLYMLEINHPEHFRYIEEHIRLVMPLFKKFKLAPMAINPNRIKLEWEQKGSDAYFDAYSLSDGTLRFICLATLLLQPAPPPLIVLDEPELGLHPSAIHILAEMIHSASIETQILLATQSVTLLDHFAVEDVIVTENVGGATVFHRLSGEEYQEWLQDYSLGELWEKNVLGGETIIRLLPLEEG
ncbi:MAG: AAA family ATPase [Magnetococcales bacterium]|nr:AAA family ATPase [Magnetococcales bacterium]